MSTGRCCSASTARRGSSKDELDAYLTAPRGGASGATTARSASELDLFSTDQRVGAGLILWHPRGALIRHEIENYERELILRHGYDLVYTPHIVSEKLFEISGHLENFKENMFCADGRRGAAPIVPSR